MHWGEESVFVLRDANNWIEDSGNLFKKPIGHNVSTSWPSHVFKAKLQINLIL